MAGCICLVCIHPQFRDCGRDAGEREINGMRKLFFETFGMFFAVVLFCQGYDLKAVVQTDSAASARKPVVVELFTSEGCSTCPPADRLLQKLEEQQPIPGADVIALEEHVDYWNHDGWNDPYSSAEWTQRQLNYGAAFKTEPYTPQMVVDGHSQFVGSSAPDAWLAIQKAVRSPKTDVAINALAPGADGSQSLTVSVGKLMGNTREDVAEVWLAVTEDGLRSSVNAGENAGRVLPHVATLRSLSKIGVAATNDASQSFTGSPRVKIDSHWDREKMAITVFVQEKSGRQILGAASTKITPRPGIPANDTASK